MGQDEKGASKLEQPWKESIHAFPRFQTPWTIHFTSQCISTSPMAVKGEFNSNQNVSSAPVLPWRWQDVEKIDRPNKVAISPHARAGEDDVNSSFEYLLATSSLYAVRIAPIAATLVVAKAAAAATASLVAAKEAWVELTGHIVEA